MCAIAIGLILAGQACVGLSQVNAEARGGYTSRTQSTFSGEGRQLSDTERGRLFVEWHEPSVSRSLLDVPSIKLTGFLRLRSENGKNSEPVSWVQPICVGIVQEPDYKPKFDRGLPYHAFAVDEVVVNEISDWPPRDKSLKAGEFVVDFPTSSIRRGIEVEREFAVAISLGSLVSGTAKWSTDAPVVRGSIGKVKVPGQLRSSPTLQKINACSNGYGWHYDPKAAVRAANELRGLGREKALKALREYLKLTGRFERFGSGPTESERIDTADPSCVEYLVEFVFGDLRDRRDRLGEIDLYRDVPFHFVYREVINRIGSPDDYSEWIDRAEQSNKFITTRWRPPDDPLNVADEYFDRLKILGKYRPSESRPLRRPDGLKYHIRRQGVRLIKSESVLKALPTLDEKAVESDIAWQELKKAASDLRLRWDDERGEYMPTPKK